MRTVILAGGQGTRLAEETEAKPKPMVEIGGRPIVWHILRHYAAYGFKEFVLALGYKSEVLKRFFVEYSGLMGSMSVEVARGKRRARACHREQRRGARAVNRVAATLEVEVITDAPGDCV